MEKIGIFGGSFDPVHNEHIKIAKKAIKKLKLDKLIIVPAGYAPHKKGASASSKDRFDMLVSTFDTNEKIEISYFEINSSGKSYTYKTVLHFKNLYPKAELFLIMGLDMLIDFPNWKNPETILENCTLAVAGRKSLNNKTKKEYRLAAKKLQKTYKKLPIYLNFSGLDVSSTKLRFLCGLKSKACAKYMPQEALDIIKTRNLYYDAFVEEVKKRMSNKRFLHTLRVAELAVMSADKFGVSVNDAFYAALFHDIAKEDKAALEKIDKAIPEPVKHAFAGAEIVRDELNIENKHIIDAVKYHTTARPKMTNLAMLIYVCDMLEPKREYKANNKLRKYLKKDAHLCFKKCLKSQYINLKKSNKPIYYITKDAYDYYFKRRKNES